MLQAITEDVHRHIILCVVGDLNAKVIEDRQYYPEAMVPHGIEDINENGALLVDYALSNDLIIGGALFEHKSNPHEYSWVSPDGQTKPN